MPSKTLLVEERSMSLSLTILLRLFRVDFERLNVYETHKLGLENLAQPFTFFRLNESKVLSKRGELCMFVDTLWFRSELF
jgi:hypothetical protein